MIEGFSSSRNCLVNILFSRTRKPPNHVARVGRIPILKPFVTAAGRRAAVTNGLRIGILPTRATWLGGFRVRLKRMLTRQLRLLLKPSIIGGTRPRRAAPRFYSELARS